MPRAHPAFIPAVPLPASRRARRCARPTCSASPPPPPAPPPPPPPPAPPHGGPPAPAARLSNVQVFAERLADTASDVRVILSRLVLGPQIGDKGPGLGRVVVLGSGWGAHSLVKIVDMSRVKSLTVVSPRNFFFFTPLLSAATVGTVEFRSIVEPLRAANKACDFYEAFAEDVDADRQVVRCVPGKREGYPAGGPAQPFDLPYDTLVVAVGETTSTFGVPGARRHAYMLKEIGDGRRLRTKILDALESASLPTWTDDERRAILRFVVVGGGPTGCEFAGELSDFVNTDLTPKYGAEFVKLIQVTLLQSGDSLLTQFEDSMQQLAIDTFRDRVEIVFNARVVEVTDSEVVLKDGRRVGYGMLVWAAGNGTRPIVSKLIARAAGGTADDATKRRGKLVVDGWMRVKGLKNVLALGDCTLMEEYPLPSTAQVAGQQGAFVGRMVSKVRAIDTRGAPMLRDSRDKELHPFRFLSLGIMAYIGNGKALVQVDTSEDSTVAVGGSIGKDGRAASVATAAAEEA